MVSERKRKRAVGAELTLERLLDNLRLRSRMRRRHPSRCSRGGGGCRLRRRRIPEAPSSPASDFLLKVDVVFGGKDARSAVDASDAVCGETSRDGCFGALDAGGTICERASGRRRQVRISCKVRSWGGAGTHRRCSASCGCDLTMRLSVRHGREEKRAQGGLTRCA